MALSELGGLPGKEVGPFPVPFKRCLIWRLVAKSALRPVKVAADQPLVKVELHLIHALVTMKLGRVLLDQTGLSSKLCFCFDH